MWTGKWIVLRMFIEVDQYLYRDFRFLARMRQDCTPNFNAGTAFTSWNGRT